MHTFYLPPGQWSEHCKLDGPEAHHAGRVLRVRAGERLRLLDGCGRLGIFRVTGVGKNEVSLEREEEWRVERPKVQCTVAAGYSKALRRGWYLEKAVELEAFALWFWQGEYSQAVLPDIGKDNWKQSLLAGAKQSVNPWLPDMLALKGGAAALAERSREFDRAFMLYEGDTKGAMLTASDLGEPGKILLVIGPEGGFSPAEADTLTNAGIRAVSLGDRILRWETAAVLTLGLAWWARQT